MLAANANSEVSKGLMSWKRESCYVTSSIRGFNVGEQIPKHEYKTAVDQAQGHIEPGGSWGPILEGT